MIGLEEEETKRRKRKQQRKERGRNSNIYVNTERRGILHVCVTLYLRDFS